MKPLTFYFDPVSPYAYLAFEALPQALEVAATSSISPTLCPACSSMGRERPGRDRTQARLDLPPCGRWRTAGAARSPCRSAPVQPARPAAPGAGLRARRNRRVRRTLLHHVWRRGGRSTDPARLDALSRRPVRDVAHPAVKAELRARVDRGGRRGMFGVPTIEVDGRLFWRRCRCWPPICAEHRRVELDDAGAPRRGVQR